ncbi:toxin-antitoxin system TumE family protein [Desulfatirhabdium butyrativorans]|uniref:toxin-antitoxin system TumE family protein n=1 Tax=Desulfatirhabdium butyrativorans TaxID=340467 RepID=UPI0004149EE3|nr:DUF6516 family protein [Desulfatirhabdium butyrativorans]
MNRFLHEILESLPDIVMAVEDFEIVQKETVVKQKVKIRLFDGSMLWVREIYVGDAMAAYSYYWLRPDGSLLIGWDNAPHHDEIDTYPHHKHLAGRVEASEERNLRDVLNFIQQFFDGG